MMYDICGSVLPLSAIIWLHRPSLGDKVGMHHPIRHLTAAAAPLAVQNHRSDSEPGDMNCCLVGGILSEDLQLSVVNQTGSVGQRPGREREIHTGGGTGRPAPCSSGRPAEPEASGGRRHHQTTALWPHRATGCPLQADTPGAAVGAV